MTGEELAKLGRVGMSAQCLKKRPDGVTWGASTTGV